MRSLLAKVRFRRDHRWAPDRMSDYLDGDLDPHARARMEHHVAECVTCRRLLAGLTLIVDRLHRVPVAEPGLDRAQLAGAVRLRLEQPPAS
jgi:anti-sigma factor RsiW